MKITRCASRYPPLIVKITSSYRCGSEWCERGLTWAEGTRCCPFHCKPAAWEGSRGISWRFQRGLVFRLPQSSCKRRARAIVYLAARIANPVSRDALAGSTSPGRPDPGWFLARRAMIDSAQSTWGKILAENFCVCMPPAASCSLLLGFAAWSLFSFASSRWASVKRTCELLNRNGRFAWSFFEANAHGIREE